MVHTVRHLTGSEFSVQASQMVVNEFEDLGSRNVTKRELTEVVVLVRADWVKPAVTGVHPLEDAETIHNWS